MILPRLTGGTQGELWRLQVLCRGLVHGVYARCSSEIAGQELQLQGARGKAVTPKGGSPEDAGQMQVKLDHGMRKLQLNNGRGALKQRDWGLIEAVPAVPGELFRLLAADSSGLARAIHSIMAL